ncbi:MAG: DUF1569 domain-containing protein [Thermoanaerobaculia bacterium]|nr:DUF1569 domain-containing protein [Thermoanaerobaculia bacterium]
MNTLFDDGARNALLRRLAALDANAARQWGTMSCVQMLAHLCVAMSDAAGERVCRQSLLGKLVTPFIRGAIFGEKPFGRNSPTHPTYIVSETREFEAERARLAELIDRFGREGAGPAAGRVHLFFGTLSGEEWGVLTHKHIDHHLRQFGG